jgi:hypothetical protein
MLLWMGYGNMHMEPSITRPLSPHVLAHIGEVSWNPGLLLHWATNDKRVLQWLRLWNNLEWFPHLLPTYRRSLAIFICCRLAYGAIISSLPPHVVAHCHWGHQLKSSVPVGGLRYKRHDCAVAVALTQHEMVPTSRPSISGVWHPSYDMDWHMEPSSGCYPQRCWPRFGKSAEILCPNWATTTNDTRILQWLML